MTGGKQSQLLVLGLRLEFDKSLAVGGLDGGATAYLGVGGGWSKLDHNATLWLHLAS